MNIWRIQVCADAFCVRCESIMEQVVLLCFFFNIWLKLIKLYEVVTYHDIQLYVERFRWTTIFFMIYHDVSRGNFETLLILLFLIDIYIYIVTFHMVYVNSLWLNDVIWRHRTWPTLLQVMTCCLTAPSHYLKRCELTMWGFCGIHLWANSYRAASRLVPSQWETSLQSNAVSHRLGPNLESGLTICSSKISILDMSLEIHNSRLRLHLRGRMV